VKIVFWGSERGSYVTSNMLILAGFLACQRGYRIAMLEMAEEVRGIQVCFSQKNEKYVKEYIRSLIERQLYYIAMDEWMQQEDGKIASLIKYLECNMDMVFINLANRTDGEARRLMHNADLTIVNLRQEQRAFDRYYASYANMPSENFLLMMGNYYYDKGYDKEYMQMKYRIPEWQLAVIPNNAEYEMACAGKCVDKYIRKSGKAWRTVRKNQFLRDIEKAAEQLCEAVDRAEAVNRCRKSNDM